MANSGATRSTRRSRRSRRMASLRPASATVAYGHSLIQIRPEAALCAWLTTTFAITTAAQPAGGDDVRL